MFHTDVTEILFLVYFLFPVCTHSVLQLLVFSQCVMVEKIFSTFFPHSFKFCIRFHCAHVPLFMKQFSIETLVVSSLFLSEKKSCNKHLSLSTYVALSRINS